MEIKKVGYIEEYMISDSVLKLSKSKKKELAREIFKKRYQGKILSYRALEKEMFVRINSDTRLSFMKNKGNESAHSHTKKIEIAADRKLLHLINNPFYVYSKEENKQGQSIRHKEGQVYHYFVKKVYIDGELFNLVIDVRQRLDGKNVVHDVILK